MKLKYLFLILTGLVLVSFSVHKDLNKKIDKEIKATYNIENYTYSFTHISQEIIKILPSKFDNKNLLSIHVADTLIGYAYLSKAASKTDEFDYLVLLDVDLIVKKTKVLVYREDYGSEIGSRRWLKQFIGKTQHDKLIYRDNVIAISGATISAQSMTLAINNLLKSLKILHSKKIL